MKTVKLLKLASLTLVVSSVLAGHVIAAETASGTATMTIQNAFDFDETTPLTFGTITARQTVQQGTDANSAAVRGSFTGVSGNTTAGVRVKSDGTANDTIAGDDSSIAWVLVSDSTTGATGAVGSITGAFDSAVREIVPGTPATFTVSNAAPFSTLTVADPAEVSVVRAGAGTNESFILDINLDDMTVVGGANDGSLVSANQPQTDATGGVSLTVGGELRINPVYSGGPLGDGTYSGTYTIEISY